MGLAVSGVMYASPDAFEKVKIEKALDLSLESLDANKIWQLTPRFDPRRRGDFIIQDTSSHHCIMNSEIADEVVMSGRTTIPDRLTGILPPRNRLIFFCVFDSGGSYGFSVFDCGALTRHRLYTVTNGEAATGSLLTVEECWAPAVLTAQEREDEEVTSDDQRQFWRHSMNGALSESGNLNRLLVVEVLEAQFGWSPVGDSALAPRRYYRHDSPGPAKHDTKTRGAGFLSKLRASLLR